MWGPPLLANDIGGGDGAQQRLAQAATGDRPETQAVEGQDRSKSAALERQLTATRHELELTLQLLNKLRDEQARAKQSADRDIAALRRDLQDERDRTARANQASEDSAAELRKSMLRDQAARRERDLAAMRRSLDPAAAARMKDEAASSAQTADASSADLQRSLQQERDRASRLEQDLAAARRDLASQTALAARAAEEAAQLKTAASGAADLQQSLQEARDRAGRLEQDLAAARGDVATQTALATKATEDAGQLKKAASDTADLQKTLQEERDRASRLEQDLAAARRDVTTQVALAAKATEDADQLKKAAAATADLEKSLQEERDRASRLAQDLAAARRDVATQTALATKATEDADQLKKAAAATADLETSLQEERDRASRLAQDLAAARRDVATQTALAAKATENADQIKKAGAAEVRKSLQEARDRASRLEQDLATARRDLAAQTTLASKTAEEAARLKKAANGGADLQKALQEARDRASRLEQDLATAQRDVATQTTLAAKATEEASQLKTAASSAADLQKSLQDERDRATRLEQDLAAARRDAATQAALVAKMEERAAQSKQGPDSKSPAQQRQALQRERDRADALDRELSKARAEIYAYDAQARQDRDRIAELKQAAESGTAGLQTSLQQERERMTALTLQLSAAQRDVETQTALANKAAAEASRLKQVAEGDSAELKRSLQQERERGRHLEEDLTAARHQVETQTNLAARAAEEINRLKQASDSNSAELRRALQREHARTAELERSLARLESKDSKPAVIAAVTTGTNAPTGGVTPAPPAAERPALADTLTAQQPEDAAEIARLVSRASALLSHGDIGSARIVLERAAAAGDPQASFKLAETYDPLTLSRWGTYGTRGDATRALDLYAKAEAGGVAEAKERLEALHR